jgi:hypothetical protein
MEDTVGEVRISDAVLGIGTIVLASMASDIAVLFKGTVIDGVLSMIRLPDSSIVLMVPILGKGIFGTTVEFERTLSVAIMLDTSLLSIAIVLTVFITDTGILVFTTVSDPGILLMTLVSTVPVLLITTVLSIGVPLTTVSGKTVLLTDAVGWIISVSNTVVLRISDTI